MFWWSETLRKPFRLALREAFPHRCQTSHRLSHSVFAKALLRKGLRKGIAPIAPPAAKGSA